LWPSYYPPNGWRCRCQAVEVRKSKYEESDSAKALESGEKATTQIGKDGKNRLEIFRFNPGKEEKLFPPKHPYNKLKGAEEVKEKSATIIPKGLVELEKKFDFEIPRELLSKIVDDFPITNNDRDNTYYSHFGEKKINVQSAYLSGRFGEWQKQTVLIHEIGHAIDRQRGLAEKEEVKALMDKYRNKYSANKNKLFKGYTGGLKKAAKDSNNDRNWKSQIGAFADTVQALDSNYGFGHGKFYYSGEFKSEREFLAHCFETKYYGNDVIKRLDPELYQDMIDLLDKLL